MKIATNIKSIKEFGFQLIIEDSKVIGINILFDKKILVKKRYSTPIAVKSIEDENKLIEGVVLEEFKF